MPQLRFQIANVVAALVWATAAIAPGALLAASYEAGLSFWAALPLVGIAAGLIVAILVIRWVFVRSKRPTDSEQSLIRKQRVSLR
jgi:membrane protein DedA with SNARE-associated domain